MAAELLGMTEAEAEVRRRIAKHGPVTFAEFMDVALYWPDGGYYATRRAFGALGDFYTAPLAHPVFGALLARQLRTMWRALGSPRPFRAIEAGAGAGRLAADIVDHAPLLDAEFGAALQYRAFDRAPAAAPVFPVGRDGGGAGNALLANELIDAMPAHRVTAQDGELREIYVEVSPEGRLTEVVGAPSTPALAERLTAVGARLAEGHRAEINLAMEEWAASAYKSIDSGYLLLIDYGREAAAYYDESRPQGTLRCYSGHTLGMDPYVRVGRQDISAHVEFTSLRTSAVAAGFTEAGSMSQAALLRGLGIDAYRRDIEERADLSRAARAANLRQLDALTDPDGMGAFRALAFAKEAPREGVLGEADGPAGCAPLPGPGHMPLPGLPGGPLPTWEELLR